MRYNGGVGGIISKEFSKFRIGMEKQLSHGGGLAPSLLVTYESGKLIAVETWLTPISKSVKQERWLWEITVDELTLTCNAFGLGDEVFHFKRV
jgi:hypothetical protein